MAHGHCDVCYQWTWECVRAPLLQLSPFLSPTGSSPNESLSHLIPAQGLLLEDPAIKREVTSKDSARLSVNLEDLTNPLEKNFMDIKLNFLMMRERKVSVHAPPVAPSVARHRPCQWLTCD